MFYSQDILQKRSGKFGIIWIAAIDSKRLNKRDYVSVNVISSSDDIMDYICLRAKPRYPGGARPRLSLYLASQLLFGLTKVYGKQGDYLLADATSLSSRCHMMLAPVTNIDLMTVPRPDLVTNPDFAAAVSSRNDPGFDPTFGAWDHLDIIDDMKKWESQALSPQIMLSPFIHQGEMQAPSPPHTVSSSEITMVEEEGPPDYAKLEIKPVDDLPMLSDQEFEHIMEMSRLELQLEESARAPQVVSTPIQHPGLTGPSHRKLPPLEETPIGDIHLGDMIPEPTPKHRKSLTQPPDATPKAPTPPKGRAKRKSSRLALELSPTVLPSPRRARRKRPLPFFDADIQIPKTVLRQNLQTSGNICRKFELPDVTLIPVAKMFQMPARKELQKSPLAYLWRRNAVQNPTWIMSDIFSETTSTSEEEVKQTLGESVELERQEDITGQSIELAREASVTLERSRQMDQTSISLHSEKSLQESVEKLVSIEEPPPRKRQKVSVGTSSEDDVVADFQPEQLDPDYEMSEARGFSKLYTVPESLEEEQMMMDVVTEQPSYGEEHLIRSIAEQTSVVNYTTFRDICPVETTSRLKAAKTFSKILDFCASNKVKCVQSEAYGDIHISRGQAW